MGPNIIGMSRAKQLLSLEPPAVLGASCKAVIIQRFSAGDVINNTTIACGDNSSDLSVPMMVPVGG